MLYKWINIIAGGGVGALSRFFISGLTHRLISQQWKLLGVFPWGTLAVNCLGSFIIGFAWALSDRFIVSSNFRSFFFIGFLGSFTTFSTFSLETFQLLRQSEFRIAFVNILLNNLGCISLAFLGFFLFSYLFRN